MNKRLLSGKFTAIWAIISSVIILLGIVLVAVLGFNTAADGSNGYRFEVRYDSIVTVKEGGEESLQTICEQAFTAQGLNGWTKQVYDVTGGGVLEYSFAENASKDHLAAAKAAVKSATDTQFADSDVFVNVHSVARQDFIEPVWRGAVAIAVGVIVALIYIAFRFGIASALSGLISAAHDVLLTLALVIVCRIPVYVYTPLIMAGISALLSLALHIVRSNEVRAISKSAKGLAADEVLCGSVSASFACTVIVLGATAVGFLLLGGLATAGVAAFFLPALITVVVGTYSSLVFSPAVHAQLKAKFDRFSAKKKRYSGAKAKTLEEGND